jgi:hypothetical protein
MKRSPIQLDELVIVSARKVKQVRAEFHADAVLVAVKIGKTWHFRGDNVSPHDELFIARQLIDSADENLQGGEPQSDDDEGIAATD